MTDSHTTYPISSWLSLQRQRSDLIVKRVPFDLCEKWSFITGRLQHETRRYFSIIGYYCDEGPSHLKGLSLPMIDQPEIGILGFVVRRGSSGWDWLLQAKTEPGNVGGTQIGPTVQATFSNYTRVHGGEATKMIDLFIENRSTVQRISDVEQSEQGDRFIGKFNRNMLIEVDQNYACSENDTLKWFPGLDLREALHLDFAVNTDARSVLISSDWSFLTDATHPEPFSKWQRRSGFGKLLFESYRVCDRESGYIRARRKLDKENRNTLMNRKPIGLDKLKNWRIDDSGIFSTEPQMALSVQSFSVSCNDREVTKWCQPLIVSPAESSVVLVCAQQDGALRFMLDISIELGFKEPAQFGPTWVSAPGHSMNPCLIKAINDVDTITHATVLQSDEGGRFMQSIARYQVVELSAALAEELATNGIWVSLSALRIMAATKGLLTNELRSALSLLLRWV